jgi:HlyD family secretion protein
MDREVTPALQSIQRYMIVGMIMFGFVTFGIGGWAATSQLSGAVIGQGVVVVDSSVKKVQHATGGIVGELRVREGDRVNAGDILIRLDETQTLANATIVTKSLDELLARQARLEAERDGADQIIFPKVLLERTKDSNSEAGRAIAAENKLFDLRRQARSEARSCRKRSRAIWDRLRQSRRKSSLFIRNSKVCAASGRRIWCQSLDLPRLSATAPDWMASVVS